MAAAAAYTRQRLVDATRANAERYAEVLDLDTSDELVAHATAQLCTRLFAEGFMVGMGEVLKQADAQGIPLTLNIDDKLFDDDGPLCHEPYEQDEDDK